MNAEFFHRWKAEIILMFYWLFCLAALVKRWDLWVRAVRALIFYLLFPSTLALSQLVSYGRHIGSRIPALATAFHESQILREKLRHNAFLEVEVRELRAENERLRTTLSFDQRTFPGAMACEIIARDPGNWFSSVVINRGEKDGLETGSPLVSYSDGRIGLVGCVEELSGRSAKVLLISDVLSSVSVCIGPHRELAVLQGRGSRKPWLTFIDPQAQIRVGDEVVTAGLGKTWPEGIPVGYVTQVESPSGLSFSSASVRTFAPLSQLKEVVILRRNDDR